MNQKLSNDNADVKFEVFNQERDGVSFRETRYDEIVDDQFKQKQNISSGEILITCEKSEGERPETHTIEISSSNNSRSQIRKKIFIAIGAGILFLIALSLRDLIREMVKKQCSDKNGIKARILELILVSIIAIAIAYVVYYFGLDED